MNALNARNSFPPLSGPSLSEPSVFWQTINTFRQCTRLARNPPLLQPKGPQSLALDIKFPDFHYAYGIPEHASDFALATTTSKDSDGNFVGEPFRLYNLDVYEYLSDSVFGLYGSIPFLLAHSAGAEGGLKPRTVGAFWLNAAEMYVDVSNWGNAVEAHWRAAPPARQLLALRRASYCS